MLRLVQVTTVPRTAVTFLRGQLRYLRHQGFDITLVSSPGPELGEFAEQEGIHFAEVAMRRAIAPSADAMSVSQLCRTLRRVRPHIVHAHTPKAGLLAMLAAVTCHVPVRIYHLHGLRLETMTGARRCLLRAAERLTCQLAHRVLCVSPSVRAAAIDEGVLNATKSRVLVNGSINGIDMRRFDRWVGNRQERAEQRQRLGIPANAPCIGYVGRLVRDKGIAELHAAWRQLREQYLDAHLLLVGPFEEEDPIPASVRADLQQDPRVRITGPQWQPEPYFSAMDVVTLPSHREGLGMTLLEAAAMRLPVVTCQVTGCVDAVQSDRTGLVVPPRDPVALAAALARYLDSPDLRRQHGLAGSQWVRHQFRPQSIWEATFEAYRELLPQSIRVAAAA